MLGLAGKLLTLSGILLVLAFVFQLPYLYELFNGTALPGEPILIPVLWRLGLLLAGGLLIWAGRRLRKTHSL